MPFTPALPLTACLSLLKVFGNICVKRHFSRLDGVLVNDTAALGTLLECRGRDSRNRVRFLGVMRGQTGSKGATEVFIYYIYLASCPLGQSMEICKSLHIFVPPISDLALTRCLCSTRGARPPPPAAADRGRPPPRGSERGLGGQRGGEEGGGRGGEEAVRLGGERRGLPPRARRGREGFRYLNSSIFLCFFLRWDSPLANNECDFCVPAGCETRFTSPLEADLGRGSRRGECGLLALTALWQGRMGGRGEHINL